jgi:hypothetical protein
VKIRAELFTGVPRKIYRVALRGNIVICANFDTMLGNLWSFEERSVPRKFAPFCRTVSLLVIFTVTFVTAAYAQTPLKTIDNPNGGRTVYGTVDGANSEASAMGIILRSMHQQYADRPQVGNVFRVRNTNSVAVFFTLIKRNQGNAPIAGMIIASRVSATDVEAALLSDDAARFGKSINPMLTTLFKVWRPGGAQLAASQGSGQASPGAGGAKFPTMHTVTTPDHSVTVSLPDGWKMRDGSNGGTLIADGPNGELASLGFPYGAMNSADPRVQRTMQFAQSPQGRNTSYAKALYYPYGQDPGKTFIDLNQMRARLMGQQPATIEVKQKSVVPNSRCVHLQGILDRHDGKGQKAFNTVFCIGPLSPMGQYMDLAYHTEAPAAQFDRELPVLGAILQSYNVDMNIVNREAGAIAAPAIAQIHAIGQAAAQQAASAHAAEDAHNQAVEARWDAQDRQNQGFSNYLLDQTVIQDNSVNGHATVWNGTADALVKADPNRFEIVNTPNYWKGIDY